MSRQPVETPERGPEDGAKHERKTVEAPNDGRDRQNLDETGHASAPPIAATSSAATPNSTANTDSPVKSESKIGVGMEIRPPRWPT